MKKTIVKLAFLLLMSASFTACLDDTMESDPITPELGVENSVSKLDLEQGITEYIQLFESQFSKKDEKLVLYTELIGRKIKQSGQELKKENLKKVIMVPSDFPTLSEAVENASPGGKIFIKGEISESGDVIINTPGISIQGQGSSPKLVGGSIIITTNDVTIQNIHLDKAITLINASKITFMDLHISNSINEENDIAALLLINSSNNLIKNTTYEGGFYENGIYLDETSNSNVIENTISKNTAQISSDRIGFAFRIEGSDNTIQKCQALNFYNGFGSGKGLGERNKFIASTASNCSAGFAFLNFTNTPTNSLDKTVSLLDCTANSNDFGFLIIGQDSFISNATAVQNGNLNFVTSGIFILYGKFFIEKSKIQKNRNSGILVAYSSGTLKENNTDSNAVGINLGGVTNSFIIGNTSTMNSICDFAFAQEIGPNLNVQFSGNNFGTTCIL
jgi:hypothetical protein